MEAAAGDVERANRRDRVAARALRHLANLVRLGLAADVLHIHELRDRGMLVDLALLKRL